MFAPNWLRTCRSSNLKQENYIRIWLPKWKSCANDKLLYRWRHKCPMSPFFSATNVSLKKFSCMEIWLWYIKSAADIKMQCLGYHTCSKLVLSPKLVGSQFLIIWSWCLLLVLSILKAVCAINCLYSEFVGYANMSNK